MALPAKTPAWLPHVAPYALFLVLVELERRWPAAGGPLLLAKVLLPAACLAAYAARGHFPELRGPMLRVGGLLADVGVGLAVAILWMAPYVLGVLPAPLGDPGFDRSVFGAERTHFALAVRLVGFAAVTPFVEELFVRSFLIRFAELLHLRGGRLEIDRSGNFRALPMARYGARSFWFTMVWFTLSHASWEWPVAFATCAIYNAWLYRRGHLGAVIRAHAVTNAAIFAAVLAAEGRGVDWSWFL